MSDLARATRPRPARHLRGAALVEFAVIATLALIPLVMFVLQLGLLYSARHTLNHATFLAARAGAVENGSRRTMERYLAKGLSPLYVRSAGDLSARDVAAVGARAYASALLDARRPDLTRLRILNPTSASFRDFERLRDGVRTIPNDALRYRSGAPGTASEQTLLEANLLRIEVDYCYRLLFPVIDRLLTTTLRRFDPDPFRQGCYAATRLPIRAHALVQMQSPSRRDLMAPLG